MQASIIFYTDNRIKEPIKSAVQNSILKSGLPIVSVSLMPIDFGENYVLEGRRRSYPTMIDQIILALEKSQGKNVFFCEHDVLYNQSHFDFIPPRDDIFYYNDNVWRWWLGADKAIRYDRMLPLSCMCANRGLALEHYRFRATKIKEMGWDQIRSREPRWARLIGYEPGTKKIKRGGLTDDDFATWSSKQPVVDIRHHKTFSSPKIHLEDFKHQPKNWQEIDINQITNFNLWSLVS